MTERKPPGVSFESWVDRQIREAQERGAFDDLPGAGKPLPGHQEPYDENWWLKRKISSEDLSLLPPSLALRKEAEEEAGLPADLLRDARRTATLSYAMARPDGLRRDWLHCYDVDLPESFAPRPVDGEIEWFELWPLRQVLDRVRRTDDFKFNVNLVLIDLFLREGLVDPAGSEGRRLRAALDAP